MLVARRDPPFHSGAYEAAHPPGHTAAQAVQAPHATRVMTALQIIGSVLAIPVGLASGYSIYHANFSAEARCQGLRANIISMLDKSVDASTLRMLVRRDVASFEGTCGAIDPDAVAAFKTLLASGKAPAPAHVAQPQAAQAKAIAPPKALPPAIAQVRPVKREQAVSDANWIASVRQALVHAPSAHDDDVTVARARVPAPPPLGELRGPVVAPAVAPAPAMPRAAAVAAAPKPPPDVAHPVPPASIPESVPAQQVAQSVMPQRRTGITGLIAEIPLLGRIVGR